MWLCPGHMVHIKPGENIWKRKGGSGGERDKISRAKKKAHKFILGLPSELLQIVYWSMYYSDVWCFSYYGVNILSLPSLTFSLLRFCWLTGQACKTINLLHNKKQKLGHIFNVEFRQSSKAFGNLRVQWQCDAVQIMKKEIWLLPLNS